MDDGEAGNEAPKTLAWPHRGLDENALARAGFYFEPTADKPDNVVCYLCHARIGGWEDDDNPIEEHLRLSPHCGWAIVTAIEAGLGDYNMDDPSHPDMMEARKQTFALRWPHEGKRAWKCKTKQLTRQQMVDAGWKYTPTIDSDDMATCTYCQLALDGWEPADKPILIDQYQQGPLKKTSRAKGARASKASRLSVQSVATFASEAPSTLADYEDSVMTTASVVTAGGTKKPRAKKATTARAKKTRVKKDEHIEVLEDPPEDEIPPPPPPKPTRGRKRASDSVDDSVLTNAEAPAPKKRVTRTRQSNNVETSVVESHADQSMADAFPAPPAKTTQKKARASRAKNTRKLSTASTVSAVSIPDEAEVPNDEEIDRQLQEDLDRQLSEDEAIAADSDSGRRKAPAAKSKAKKAPAKKKSTASNNEQPLSDHAMFDPTPVEVDDADVSAELKTLRANMEAEEASTLQVPKKGRKAAGTTRKASKQTKAQKAKAQPAAEQEPEPEPEAAPAPVSAPKTIPAPTHSMSEDELSFDATMLTTASAPAKKRGRPKKNSTQPPPAVEEPKPKAPPRVMSHVDFSDDVQMSSTPRPAGPTLERGVSPSPAPEISETPATPKPVISPAPTARQSALSPSQSPQASDEENQPPSSKPSNTANSSRVAMDPVDATPAPSSPSKRNANVLHGLASTHPWTAVDLDMVFQDLNKENAGPASHLQKGAQLTSPEKKMTVEEWINHNAGLAEDRLKSECEAMVSKFEQEGGRAMRVLEELVTAE
ncbi:uncharacterized protein PG998_004008 [Apiospora kogelbergensis]|uniref:uncharacterized protein n=1 Tax=Apiospora kogelbergensis TaxID=1337665 RepID=UPI003130A22C